MMGVYLKACNLMRWWVRRVRHVRMAEHPAQGYRRRERTRSRGQDRGWIRSVLNLPVRMVGERRIRTTAICSRIHKSVEEGSHEYKW